MMSYSIYKQITHSNLFIVINHTMFHLPMHEGIRLDNDMKKTTTSVDIDGIPSNSPIFTAVQFIEFLDVFIADLETKNIEIGAHTVRILRLGEGDETGPIVRRHK